MGEEKIPPLVPFLLEERESWYARNVANRIAEVLDLEVLPMLDRIEDHNRFPVDTAPFKSLTGMRKVGHTGMCCQHLWALKKKASICL
jgi:hypothetical protein